jgi:Domain of unknown function (DUF4129)
VFHGVGQRCLRLAVIRAYARIEQTFAAHGVPREKADTPLEHLTRVLEGLSVSASSARRLTELYEHAKFSSHAIDPTMKDDAIEALAGLRAELEQTTGRSLSTVNSPSSNNPLWDSDGPRARGGGTTPVRLRSHRLVRANRIGIATLRKDSSGRFAQPGQPRRLSYRGFLPSRLSVGGG